MPLEGLRLLTLDFWGTLVHQAPELDSFIEDGLVHLYVKGGRGVDEAAARLAMRAERRGFAEALRTEYRTKPLPERLDDIAVRLSVPLPLDAEREADALLAEALQRHEPSIAAGSCEALEDAKRSGLRVCVISNTGWIQPSAVRDLLKTFGLMALVDECICSGDGFRAKPHPEMFDLAVMHCGCSTGAVIHVGDDRRTDVAGGLAAGLGVTVLIQDAAGSGTEGPVFGSVRELREIFSIRTGQ